jgi:hypothetical protein
VRARPAPAGDRWYFLGTAAAGTRRGKEPLLAGQFARGPYQAHHWVELSVLADAVPHPAGGKPIAVAGTALERRLLVRLTRLIPPGGHLMVEYESAHRRETFDALVHGVPAAATPLGHALFRAGAGDSFKDWYYAEGGMEGPRKLQGNRALDAADRRRQRAALQRELRAFLRGKLGSADDRARARAVLHALISGSRV